MEVNKNSGLATYGVKDAENAIICGAASIVIMSDSINQTRLVKACVNSHEEIHIVNNSEAIKRKSELSREKCKTCESDVNMHGEDLVEYFALLASQYGAKAEVISGKAEYGIMIENLGGIAVLLKYRMR